MVFEIGIAEPGDFSNRALDLLRSAGNVSTFDATGQSLTEFIEDKHILFIRLKHFWGEELLSRAKKLQYLCTPTTGLTHIDTGFAKSAGITVLSLKGETDFLDTISATAEHTFGLAIALVRKYGHSFLKPGNAAWDRDRFKGCEIKGMSAGIIGMGRVGAQLSGYLSAFGAKLFYYDIREDVNSPHEAKRVNTISELVDAAQMIFLCASFEEENRHMIDTGVLERMRDKYFINTSRGEMVDENALLQLAGRGHFAGVALDVLEGEPDNIKAEEFAGLSGKHNVIVTPHIAGATYPSMHATEEFIAKKLVNELLL